MSTQKCSNCGLVNWADAANCKRCDAPLQQFGVTAMRPSIQVDRPPRVLGFMIIIWGLLMFAAGLFLLRVGGTVHPIVLAGPVILISGILVMRGHVAAPGLYFLGIIGMCVWLAATKNAPFAIGSFIFPGLIGLLVAKRRFPILAGFLIVLSCVALLAPFLIAGMLGPSKVVWRDFRPAHGLFTVRMPSEPRALDPIVKSVESYTMTNHRYESLIRGQGATLYVVVNFSPAISVEGVSYEEMLDLELNGMIKRTSSTLISKRSTTVNGYPGLEFELKPPDNLALASPRVFGKVFMNSEHLYVMAITASEGSELLASKDDFLNPTFSYPSSNEQAAESK